MNLKLYSYIITGILIVSCRNNSTSQIIDPKSYEGWWISTTIADSTVRNKTIHNFNNLVQQDAMILEIKNDTIYTYGNIIYQKQYPVNCIKDTLGKITGMATINIIAKRENLILNNKRKKSEYNDIFRRANTNEQRDLTENLSKTSQIADKPEKWYARKILSGSYKDREGSTITLTKNSGSQGFENFTTYEIHVTRGTVDWMKNDWIKFTNSKSDQQSIYHFKFEGNNLKLYEYSMREVEAQYEIGKLKHNWKLIN